MVLQALPALLVPAVDAHQPGGCPGIAYISLAKEHRAKLHSMNPIERLNGEIKRRTGVVGIFPSDDAIVHLVGASPPEQNDEWVVQRARSMTLGTVAPMGDDAVISLPAMVS